MPNDNVDVDVAYEYPVIVKRGTGDCRLLASIYSDGRPGMITARAIRTDGVWRVEWHCFSATPPETTYRRLNDVVQVMRMYGREPAE